MNSETEDQSANAYGLSAQVKSELSQDLVTVLSKVGRHRPTDLIKLQSNLSTGFSLTS